MTSPDQARPASTSALTRASASAGDGGARFLLGAIAVLLLGRIPVLAVREFNADEFEHAHAAWSVFRGLLPYKDFFEHHTPWYYFLLAPFFRWFPAAESFSAGRHFLLSARVLSLALAALSAWLIFLAGRQRGGRRVGLLAALLLVAQPVLIRKTLEIRPDVPALAFFLGALCLILRGLGAQEGRPGLRVGYFLGGGLCLGAAVMCTQKMLFVLPGTGVGLGLWALAGGRRALVPRLSAALVLAVGAGLPVLLTWAAFALRGGGAQFIYNNFLLNARWRWYSGRHLSEVLTTSAPMLALGLLGIGSALLRRGGAAARDHGDLLLLAILGGLIAGVIVVPAAYEQYYLPPLAIACLFAARGLCALLDRSRHRGRGWLVACATVPLMIWPAVDLIQASGERDDAQMQRLQFVYAHTGPTQPVLDGWLGTNVFRPHPHYYFFMHGELRTTLTETEKDAYIEAVMQGAARPALITLDQELRAFGPRLLQLIERDYVTGDGLFYLPAPPAARRP